MDTRSSLYVAAIVMVIVATSIEATPVTPTLKDIRGKLRGWQSATGAAEESRPSAYNFQPSFSPKFQPRSGPRFQPSVGFPSHGSGAAAAVGNDGKAAAMAHIQPLNRHEFKVAPRFAPRFASSFASADNNGAHSSAAVMEHPPRVAKVKGKPRFAVASAGPAGASAQAQSSGPRSFSTSRASTGTFNHDNNGLRTSKLKHNTETETHSEEGSEDSNNYQRASSLSSNYDDTSKTEFQHHEEEEESTGQTTRRKSVKQNFVQSATSRGSEMGTDSEARQSRSSGFKKVNNKKKEAVKQKEHVEGNGAHNDSSFSESNEVEEEEEEKYDSDGLDKEQPPMMAQASASNTGATASASGFAPQPAAAKAARR